MKPKLSDMEERFVELYMRFLSINKVAKMMEISRPAAWELRQRLNVEEAIAGEQAQRRCRTILSIDKVIEELALILSSDITDYFDNDWYEAGVLTFKEFKGLPSEATRAIQSLKTKKDPGTGEVLIEIKLYDKMKASDQAARHLGLFKDQLKILMGQDPDAGPVNTRSHVTVVGQPNTDMSIADWEKQCKEADEAREVADILDEEEG